MRTKPPTDLGTVFFGAYRRQVLGLLLLHPGESFHLREMACATKTQPGTLRRELELLTDAGDLAGRGQGTGCVTGRTSPVRSTMSCGGY